MYRFASCLVVLVGVGQVWAVAGTMLFDEHSDTIKVAGQTVIGTAATYEARIMFTDAYAGVGYIFHEWEQAAEDKQLYAGPTYIKGYSYGVNSPSALEVDTTVSLGSWHHLAYVYDGSQERIYLDGVRAGFRPASAIDVRDSSGPAFVGALFKGPLAPSFVGYMDTLRVSDVARYSGLAFIPPVGDLTSDANTQLLYNFNDAVGSMTVLDESPLGRSGTLGVGFAGATSPTLVPEPWTIVGRHVFYNNSAFDSVGELTDNDAVAIDKRALLPGQTASFDNYTSYTKGINGIMVDVSRLAGTPTADDFRFRVGNDNDPTDWATLEETPLVTVRPGEGADGADRIAVVFSDNTISQEWLQVTMKATDENGLAEDDVFYFGNAVGEVGNSDGDAKVNAFDMLGARDNQRSFLDPAPIDFAYDFDRDGRVNAIDMLIARDNTTSIFNDLNLITVPGGKGTVPEPSTFTLLLVGAIGLLGWGWPRRRPLYVPSCRR